MGIKFIELYAYNRCIYLYTSIRKFVHLFLRQRKGKLQMELSSGIEGDDSMGKGKNLSDYVTVKEL